jgi:hypothetical protein
VTVSVHATTASAAAPRSNSAQPWHRIGFQDQAMTDEDFDQLQQRLLSKK